MSTPMETIHDFMTTFIAAWSEGDAAKLGAFFSEDAAYHNIPMEPKTPTPGRPSPAFPLAPARSLQANTLGI